MIVRCMTGRGAPSRLHRPIREGRRRPLGLVSRPAGAYRPQNGRDPSNRRAGRPSCRARLRHLGCRPVRDHRSCCQDRHGYLEAAVQGRLLPKSCRSRRKPLGVRRKPRPGPPTSAVLRLAIGETAAGVIPDHRWSRESRFSAAVRVTPRGRRGLAHARRGGGTGARLRGLCRVRSANGSPAR